MNTVSLIGHLTRDPEPVDSKSGNEICNLRIAVARRGQDGAVYTDVKTFGKQAAVCTRHLRRGREIAVSGRLELDEWETENGKRSRLYVIADRIDFLGSGGGGYGRGFGRGFGRGRVVRANRNAPRRVRREPDPPEVEDPELDASESAEEVEAPAVRRKEASRAKRSPAKSRARESKATESTKQASASKARTSAKAKSSSKTSAKAKGGSTKRSSKGAVAVAVADGGPDGAPTD